MITDYTLSPKVQLEAPNTSSDSGTIIYVSGWGYWMTRSVTRERYEYRGLSEEAAIACAAAEVTANTVTRAIPIYNPTTAQVEYINKTICEALVVPSRVGDSPVWRVSVTKQHEDVTFQTMGWNPL